MTLRWTMSAILLKAPSPSVASRTCCFSFLCSDEIHVCHRSPQSHWRFIFIFLHPGPVGHVCWVSRALLLPTPTSVTVTQGFFNTHHLGQSIANTTSHQLVSMTSPYSIITLSQKLNLTNVGLLGLKTFLKKPRLRMALSKMSLFDPTMWLQVFLPRNPCLWNWREGMVARGSCCS